MFDSPLAPDWLRAPDDANALPAPVWSRNAVRAVSGELEIAGVPASALAAEFGTPVFVIDEADVRERAERAATSFVREFERVGSSARVYYAAKAFLCTEVARWVTEAGLNIDVASGGELAVTLAAGVDATRLVLHGNNKSLAELDRAVSVGIGTIVLDSLLEINRVAEVAARHGVRQAVRLRVNSGVHASTHEYLATAREDQKFGVPLSEVEDAVARIRSHDSLDFLGLHSHIGSQIFDTDGFVEAAARLLGVHARLLSSGPVPELNLGGGFGIAYTSVDTPAPIEHIAARFADIVRSECAALGIPVPVVAVEPGRSIIGPSTTTLYTVGMIKDVEVTLPAASGVVADPAPAPTAVRKYVSVDGGMSDNVRPALYGADYSVRLANRSSDVEPVLVRIAGKHCESGDIVVHADYLPGDVAPGDLAAVPATGAYCWSLASNYNYLTRPPVVAVRDGVARAIVRGETEQDLLSRDLGITSDTRAAASPPATSAQDARTAPGATSAKDAS
ncbi:diaminopimelate decarboxylase [Planctomonas psychrotolerans]|uniref:diaminopimelate decarboxylase n=1 Tax=Planctomonas psychrotolerans TaxID=2528712 RepID=UPI00123C2454|nr:diaminopimelate decarboxylase [Planctomonas psychrotolerans]